MSAAAWAALGTALGTLAVILSAVFTARASTAASRATAEAQRAAAIVTARPEERAVDLDVLQVTVKRVDEENGALRRQQARLEVLLRAFSWTCDRWAGQMRDAHIEPSPPHPLVEEYNRTGV